MPDWPDKYRPIEVLQRPGETMFVPSGWWHVVMNLTDTVAITQNFVSTTNFHIVWHKTVRSRPKLSKKWLDELKLHRPDLVELTKKIDINSSIGVTTDSSSGSSSSSSSSSSTCSCSSCQPSESDDSGQVSLTGRKKRRIDNTTDERGDDDSMSSDESSWLFLHIMCQSSHLEPPDTHKRHHHKQQNDCCYCLTTNLLNELNISKKLYKSFKYV